MLRGVCDTRVEKDDKKLKKVIDKTARLKYNIFVVRQR